LSRFKKHIFICSNERKPNDPRGCCVEKGATEILDYARNRIHQMGLKGQVRVNKAGCLDACKYGPTMVIYPDDVWYSLKKKEDVEEILSQHVEKDEIVDRLRIRFD